jgi:hypothetical protein
LAAVVVVSSSVVVVSASVVPVSSVVLLEIGAVVVTSGRVVLVVTSSLGSVVPHARSRIAAAITDKTFDMTFVFGFIVYLLGTEWRF